MNRGNWARNLRALTSSVLLFSGIIVLLTGIMLWIAPSGRVAKDINRKPGGMNRELAKAVHTVVGYLMTAFAIVHIFLNARPMRTYFGNLWFWIGLVIVLIVFFGTKLGIPPFSTIAGFGES